MRLAQLFTKLVYNSPPNRQTSFKWKEFFYKKYFVFTDIYTIPNKINSAGKLWIHRDI